MPFNSILFTYDDLISAYHPRDILGLGYLPFDKKSLRRKINPISTWQQLNCLNTKPCFSIVRNLRCSQMPPLRQPWRKASTGRKSSNKSISVRQTAHTALFQGIFGYNSKVEAALPYSLDHARQLLDQAGYILTSWRNST